MDVIIFFNLFCSYYIIDESSFFLVIVTGDKTV